MEVLENKIAATTSEEELLSNSNQNMMEMDEPNDTYQAGKVPDGNTTSSPALLLQPGEFIVGSQPGEIQKVEVDTVNV